MDSSRSLLLALTCVAVLATACTSEGADPQGSASPTTSSQDSTSSPAQPSPTATSGTSTPSGYDELANWSSGDSDPSMTATGKLMGVGNLTFPRPGYVDMGWVGVAPFEKYCIIAFHSVDNKPDQLAAAVLSRYNTRMTITIQPGTPQQLKSDIDTVRVYCQRATVTLPTATTTTA